MDRVLEEPGQTFECWEALERYLPAAFPTSWWGYIPHLMKGLDSSAYNRVRFQASLIGSDLPPLNRVRFPTCCYVKLLFHTFAHIPSRLLLAGAIEKFYQLNLEI